MTPEQVLIEYAPQIVALIEAAGQMDRADWKGSDLDRLVHAYRDARPLLARVPTSAGSRLTVLIAAFKEEV